MKKAYVKPVFLAEEFECTAAVAGCAYSAKTPAQVFEGMHMCGDNSNDGHVIGGNSGDKGFVNKGKHNGVQSPGFWDYATGGTGTYIDDAPHEADPNKDLAYLFTDSSTVCDFIWNSRDSQVGVWTSKENDWNTAIANPSLRNNAFVTLVSSFANFFFGNSANWEGHTPIYGDQKIFS